uniref:hypothetical protein n=1 Tax=Pseudomonas sp. TaxID=306 RepID=UPI0035639480
QVISFSHQDSSFPNDGLANQFFDERHLDAYRELGRENIRMALKTLEGEAFSLHSKRAHTEEVAV